MYDVTSYSAQAWLRLGEAVRRRRVGLGKTLEQLADEAECSVNTIRNLEQGKRSRHLTLPKVNRALGWVEDSYILILEGGMPVVEEPISEQSDALHLERPEGLSDDEWAEIREKMIADLEFWLRRRGR